MNEQKEEKKRNTTNYIPSSPFNIDGWLLKWTANTNIVGLHCKQEGTFAITFSKIGAMAGNEVTFKWHTSVGIGSMLVPFKEFQSQQIFRNAKDKVIKNKEGKEMKIFFPVKYCVTLKYITAFIENLLKNIVHHRNQLRSFRNNKIVFMEKFSWNCLTVFTWMLNFWKSWPLISSGTHSHCIGVSHYLFWVRQNFRRTENAPSLCIWLKRS